MNSKYAMFASKENRVYLGYLGFLNDPWCRLELTLKYATYWFTMVGLLAKAYGICSANINNLVLQFFRLGPDLSGLIR